jgi:hypothetical protein
MCIIGSGGFAVSGSSKTGDEKAFPVPSEKEYLLGKYRCSRHPGFRRIDSRYSDASPHYLLADAARAFEKMGRAAEKDGVSLRIVSGFRSFARQKQIFEAKFLGKRLVEGKNLLQAYPHEPEKRVARILRYSAAPGTSRHHWGTDLDINSVSPVYFERGEGKKVFEWLKQNAARYGFHRPYTEGRLRGYAPEEWHWSYVPLSRDILKRFLRTVSREDITGFAGENALPDNLIEDYVLGIHDACL